MHSTFSECVLPMRFNYVLGIWFVLLQASVCNAAPPAKISFRRDIAPILLDHCVACHSEKNAEGGYRVDAFQHFVGGGDSGETAIEPANVVGSEAIRRIMTDDVDTRMPAERPPLPDAERQTLRMWVEQGALFDGKDTQGRLIDEAAPRIHPKPPLHYPAPIPITAIAFGPNHQSLYVGGYHEINVWRSTGELLRRLGNHGQRTHAIRLSPNGERIAVVSGTPGKMGDCRIVDTQTGQVLHVVGPSHDVPFDVQFAPDGSQFAVGYAEGRVHIFDADDGKARQRFAIHSDWVTSVAWSPDGTRLLSTSRDKTAKILTLESGEVAATFAEHQFAIRGAAFLSDGHIVSADESGKIIRWNSSDAKKVEDFAESKSAVHALANSSKHLLFAGGRHATLVKIEDKGKVALTGEFQHNVVSVAFSRDGRFAATGTLDGQVKVFRTNDGSLVQEFLAMP